MMFFLERLRERPEEDRRAIAVGSAVTVMSILLIGWGIATLYSIDATPAETQAASPVLSDTQTQRQAQRNTYEEELRRVQAAYAASSNATATGTATTSAEEE